MLVVVWFHTITKHVRCCFRRRQIRVRFIVFVCVLVPTQNITAFKWRDEKICRRPNRFADTWDTKTVQRLSSPWMDAGVTVTLSRGRGRITSLRCNGVERFIASPSVSATLASVSFLSVIFKLLILVIYNSA